MLYLIGLFIPPLAMLFAGRILTALICTPLWIVGITFTLGLGHLLFVVLSWVVVASAKGDKRHKELLKARE